MVHTFKTQHIQTENFSTLSKIDVNFCKTANFPSPLIPDLIAIQYGSFQEFLSRGFPEAFESINPLVCTYGPHTLKIKFFPEQIQFRKPEGNAKYALHFG